MLTPRDYQVELVSAVRDAFRQHRRVLMQAPTGAGKGAMLSLIAQGLQQKGNSCTIVAHRKSIVRQISATLDSIGVRHGRIQPGHTETDDPVQVGMIQTVCRRVSRLRKPSMVLVDECHHRLSSSYDLWPDVKELGLTATPWMLDGRGLEKAYDTMVVGPSVRTLIDRGYLAEFDLYAPPSDLDLSHVRTRMGEFSAEDLAVEMKRSSVMGDVVRHYKQYLDHKPTIVFCIDVEDARLTAERFRAEGYRALAIDGSAADGVNEAAIDGLASGKHELLMACDVISEGTDIPVAQGVILKRPTKSLVKYLQQVGRVLRLKPDGSRAIILDHVGNVHRHGMPDAEREWTLAGRDKKAAVPGVRTCKTCYAVVPAAGPVTCAGDLPPTEPCPLLQPVPAPRKQLKTVDGDLVRVSAEEQIFPAWAGGISIVSAKGDEWKALVRWADTREKLAEIARIRGYNSGWPQFILDQRMRGRLSGIARAKARASA